MAECQFGCTPQIHLPLLSINMAKRLKQIKTSGKHGRGCRPLQGAAGKCGARQQLMTAAALQAETRRDHASPCGSWVSGISCSVFNSLRACWAAVTVRALLAILAWNR